MSRRPLIGLGVATWGSALILISVARYPGLYSSAFRETPREFAPVEIFGQRLLQMPAWRGKPFPTGATFNYRHALERTGVDTNAVIPLPVEIAWRSEDINVGIHSASKSSPAVDASGVYVGGDTGWIHAFDHDGRVKWKFHTAGANQGIHGSASLDQENVYIGSYNGRLYCLEKATGDLKWQREVADAIGSSPLIEGDSLYVSAETATRLNGYLSKFAKDGRLIWKSMWLGEQVHSSPTLDPARRIVYLGANNGELFAFHADDGRLLWQRDLGGPIKGTPLVADGRVYVASWAKKLHALDGPTGATIWETPLLERSQSSATLVPGTDFLIVASHRKGALYGIRRRDGKVAWQWETGSSMNMGSAVTVKDQSGRWYSWIGCFDRALCAIRPETGEVLQRVEMGFSVTGIPAAYGGKLYVALDKGALVRLESKPRRENAKN